MKGHKHCLNETTVVKKVDEFNSYTESIGLDNRAREQTVVPNCDNPTRGSSRGEKSIRIEMPRTNFFEVHAIKIIPFCLLQTNKVIGAFIYLGSDGIPFLFRVQASNIPNENIKDSIVTHW